MLNPVRTSAGWLTGRLFLFLLILAALVAWDAFRDESSLLSAQVQGLVPDADLVERLESGRDALAARARAEAEAVNARLQSTPVQSIAWIDARIVRLETELEQQQRRRRSTTQRTIALLTGEGFQEDLENEITIQLLSAERDALRRFKGEIGARQARIDSSEQALKAAARRTTQACSTFKDARAARDRHAWASPVLGRIPGTDAWLELRALRREVNRLAQECISKGEELSVAQARLDAARAMRQADVEQVVAASASILEPLDDLIATRKDALESARRQAEKIQRSMQRVFAQAFGILVIVTLVPLGIKAFWYWVVAPYAEKQPPIRLAARPAVDAGGVPAPATEPAPAAKISAVSQEVVVGEYEELLVHPEFLQRSAARARKDTKWLFSWRYPLTSVAARMVALDRLRASLSPASFVVSSKTDPFVEIGLIDLAAASMFVLQPRHLIGVVQVIDRPIRIHRRWRCNWHAVITLQFRYLMFEGPGKLIVQGCRGVRLEQAGGGRSIDQGATMGFSATLDYAPRRSETFSAYLMGTRALFNDDFSGEPGFYVYEEMPYYGKRPGIAGRGLQGLADGLLRVFGI